jgi:hypothetical protein
VFERYVSVDWSGSDREDRRVSLRVVEATPPRRLGEALITYAIGRVDYYERYRTTYQTIAMGLIAGAFVITSILIRGISALSTSGTVCILLAVLTLLSGAVYILWEYSKETSPNYAYRDVADIRSWYYRYYFKDCEQGGNISPPRHSPEREKQAEKYVDVFFMKSYVRTWVQHATEHQLTPGST